VAWFGFWSPSSPQAKWMGNNSISAAHVRLVTVGS
jgi:hypothetical protein